MSSRQIVSTLLSRGLHRSNGRFTGINNWKESASLWGRSITNNERVIKLPFSSLTTSTDNVRGMKRTVNIVKKRNDNYSSNYQKVEEKIKGLEKSTNEFLEKINDMDSQTSGKHSMTLYSLIDSWGALWGGRNNRPAIPATPDQILRGAQFADRLIHHLLDVEEHETLQKDATSHPKSGYRALYKRKEYLCNITMDAWSKSHSSHSPQKALSILNRMENIHKFGSPLAPSNFSYSIILTTFQKHPRDVNNAQKSQEILDSMLSIPSYPKPNNWTFSIVMDTLAHSSLKDKNERIQHYLKIMEEMANGDPKSPVKPTCYTYSIIMNAFVRSGEVSRAESILRTMIDQYRITGDEDMKPNEIIFGTVLSGYSFLRDAKQAHRVLEWMLDAYYTSNDKNLKPTCLHFEYVMEAYAKNRMPLEAELLLRQMERMHLEEEGDMDLCPNVKSFAIVLDAWVRSKKEGALDRVLAIFDQMKHLAGRISNDGETMGFLRPNLILYNTVLNAIAKSKRGGSGQWAEKILEEIKDQQILPDKVTYTCVMEAHIHGRSRDFPKKVAQILEKMEDLYETTKSPSIKPDAFVYGIALNAISKSNDNDKREQGFALLQKMEESDVAMSEIPYNVVLSMLANCGDSVAAQELLKRMETLGQSGKIKPDVISYSAVINSFAKSSEENAFEKAEAIFKNIMKEYFDGKLEWKPTTRIFNTLLGILARREDIPNRASRAWKIVQQMNELSGDGGKSGLNRVGTDMFTYNLVIRCCSCVLPHASEKDKKETLMVSVMAFNDIQEKFKTADSVTYQFLLRVCGNLIKNGAERKKAIIDLFQKCCQDGKLNAIVLNSAKNLLPEKDFHDLLGKEGKERGNRNITVEELPQEWRRNLSRNDFPGRNNGTNSDYKHTRRPR